MSIDMPAAEVHALAATLRGEVAGAEEAEARLSVPAGGGGSLQPAVEEFLACHRTLARALAGELRWLGATVAAVADSWIELDAGLLGPRGRARLE